MLIAPDDRPRRPPPPERKRRDLTHQWRGSTSSVRSLRGGRFRRLARAAHRPGRQFAAQHLRPLRGPFDVELLDFDMTPRPRRCDRWCSAKPLAEWLASGERHRAAGFARWLFRAPYETTRHRGPFVAALAEITRTTSPRSQALADHVAKLLDPPPGDHYTARSRAAWLASFFEDEPAWRPRLEAWVSAVDRRTRR